MYFEKAIALDDRNFAAQNDLAFLLYRDFKDADAAIAGYRKSLAMTPQQQRARYNLAVIHMDRGEYDAAERLLTEALAERQWQHGRSPERIADVRYNRACCYSRLAEKADPVRAASLLDQAEKDLVRATRFKTAEMRDILRDDLNPGKDLAFLGAQRPAQVQRILDDLGPRWR
jgi:tetratricopeptide (TPR) repeat protein